MVESEGHFAYRAGRSTVFEHQKSHSGVEAAAVLPEFHIGAEARTLQYMVQNALSSSAAAKWVPEMKFRRGPKLQAAGLPTK
jgi:hypothetical protein